jgi:tetratricopeptide (TPR) repeat protein
MKKFIPAFALFLFTAVYAQDKDKANKLVSEGIAYHDKGDYEGAINKYDKALEADKNNFLALAEKAMTLLALQKYDETIEYCKLAIETHPEESLKTVYVTYGNACDGLKKTDKSLEIYDEGLKHYPDFFQLHFNKGITLSSIKKYDEAILCFQKSASLNPKHASSHNALARILHMNEKRIPAVMAYCRFLIIEPESNRSVDNLKNLQTLMNGNVEKTGKKSISISISPNMLGDTTADGKPNENSFTSTDLLLSMTAALDYDKKLAKASEVEKFIRKFESMCSSLKETKKDNYGYYWDYYVPYFVEMKDKKLIETFAYIAFASSEDPEVGKWLKSHKNEISDFFEWSKNFTWKK